MTIKALVHTTQEGSFWAEVPALPGCFTQGESLDEVRENLPEAVAGWLEAGELATGTAGSESNQVLELTLRSRSPASTSPSLSPSAAGS